MPINLPLPESSFHHLRQHKTSSPRLNSKRPRATLLKFPAHILIMVYSKISSRSGLRAKMKLESDLKAVTESPSTTNTINIHPTHNLIINHVILAAMAAITGDNHSLSII